MRNDEQLIPEPRPLSAAPRLRWGLVGAGTIAAVFVDAAHTYSNQRFIAVAARSGDRAERFAHEHGIDHAHASYGALVDDPDVDVVYVATTHDTHAELALLAIAAGKHVLVEKPFATTGEEARAVAAAARGAGVLAMEGMWTRYLPQADVIRQIVEAGTIGDIRMVTADFGFSIPYDATNRLFDPSLAGGALLDAGVYPVSFASSVLGPPASVRVCGQAAPTGVDAEAALLLDHGGTCSVILTAITACLPGRASIVGAGGRVDVHPPFWGPTGLTLTLGSRLDPRHRSAEWEDSLLPSLRDGLSYEADALARFVGEGHTESPLHQLDETIAIVALLDDARRAISAS